MSDIDTEVCSFVRDACLRVTGGNAAFIDDDIMVLEYLATQAVRHRLVDGLHPSVAAKAAALHSQAPGRDMIDAPRDGTQILALMQPEPIHIGRRRIDRPTRYVLVRWYPTQPSQQGYWSTHYKGQGKVRGELLAWWPLPARRAA